MSKSERTMILIDILKIVHQVNEFSERKHAILFAVNAASSFAIIHRNWPSGGPPVFVLVVVLVLFASLATQVVALYPVLNVGGGKCPPNVLDNIFNIVQLGVSSADNLLSKVSIYTPNSPANEMDAHLAAQIVAVARIAMRKLRCFKLAATLTASAFGWYVLNFLF